jgi:2-hydroxy-6-oxonona-2,4-dienedioate hydrolase
VTAWTDLIPAGFSHGYVDANGVRTRTLRAGAGEAVVFLHGTSGHLEAFTRNVAAHAEHFEVHAIDMLGHGYTDKPGGDYTIPRYVDHLCDYLDACGIDRAHVVGESLGGWVAAWLAIERPERLGRLTLVTPGGTAAIPEVMERIRTSTRDAVLSGDREVTRKRLAWLMHDPERSVTEELLDVRHAIYQRADFRAALDGLLCLQDYDTRMRYLLRPERLGRITAPTLIVWSRANPTGDLEVANRLHEALPGSRLEVLEQSAHWPQYEQAEQFNRLNVEHLLGKA